MKNKYTKDTIIEAIQRFYDKNGKIPVARDFNCNPEYPSSSTVKNYFGSWSEAIEAAGFNIYTPDKYTTEEITAAIQRFYNTNGRIPQQKDFKRNTEYPDATTVIRHFDSWNGGILVAGFMTDKPYTAEELIEAIHCFYRKNGRIPKARDFSKNPEYPSYTTVKNYFGSWNEAIAASGFTPDVQPSYTSEDIIEAIQHFYAKHNKIPQQRDFKSNSDYPSFKTAQRQFGSWNNAIEAAGFTPNIQNGFGVNTQGLDGHLYRSQAEAYLADNYLHGKYTYDIEPQYPKPYGLYYDWYIKELDVYIELDGGLRPEHIKYKTQINKRLGRNCLVIPVAAIYRKDFMLENFIGVS